MYKFVQFFNYCAVFPPFYIYDLVVEVFETAAKYQMYGGLALILVGILQQNTQRRLLVSASKFLFAGSLIFPGSLYLICLTKKVSQTISAFDCFLFLIYSSISNYGQIDFKRFVLFLKLSFCLFVSNFLGVLWCVHSYWWCVIYNWVCFNGIRCLLELIQSTQLLII